AGLGCPRQCRGITTEVTAIRTSARAEVPMLTKRSSLLRIILIIAGDMGASSDNDIPSGIIRGYKLLKVPLRCSKLHRWQKFPVRKMGKAIFIARYADKFFNVTIPRR